MTMPTTLYDSLAATLDRLPPFARPGPPGLRRPPDAAGGRGRAYPVLSLYLDARADARGRDPYQPFVRKELGARQRPYPLRAPGRKSFDQDTERIQHFLETQVRPSSNGIAIFACAGEEDFFEALQLEAAFEENRLSVADRPQLFPLARLIDENPRYALVLANTHSARIY